MANLVVGRVLVAAAALVVGRVLVVDRVPAEAIHCLARAGILVHHLNILTTYA